MAPASKLKEPSSILKNGKLHASRDTLASKQPQSPPAQVDQKSEKPAAEDQKKKEKFPRRRDRSPTASFSDGRLIDIVLTYKPLDVSRRKRALFAKYRRKFESELRAQGMELEYESKDLSRDGRTAYVKIHSPFDTLARQAEMRRLRKATYRCDLPDDKEKSKGCCSRLCDKIFRLQKDLEYPVLDYFTEPFSRKTQQDYLGVKHENFFTPAERAYLTWDAMLNTRVEIKRKKNVIDSPIVAMGKVAADPVLGKPFAINRRHSQIPNLAEPDVDQPKADMPASLKVNIDYLLKMKVYESAYALHDSDLTDEDIEKYKKKPATKWPLRVYLYESWVKPRQFFRHQPLDAIRDYYGERVAFYFAWLGFYTKMLFLPAIVGVLVLLYGAAQLGGDELSKQACDNETTKDHVIICRSCPSKECDFKYLSEYCHLARANQVFDNEGTVVFSIFIAIWAVFVITYWKRYQAELMQRWNMNEFEGELDDGGQLRPEYEMNAGDRRKNPISGKYEPHVPFKQKAKRFTVTVVSMVFCCLIVVAFVSSIMVYRVVGPYWWALTYGFEFDYYSLVSVTSALFNGLFIGIMSKIYLHLARYLTNAENPRTDTEYNSSYTYKVVILECVNYYGVLFYLAFIRGQVMPPPHQQGGLQSRCPMTGCLFDLVIQLAIIYSGKQMFDSIVDIVIPIVKVSTKKCLSILRKKGGQHKDIRWEDDYTLQSCSRFFLFSDYLRLFIQYGFVTMFVPAFPLAPLFALFNNIAAIRLNAYKVLVLHRRSPPVPINQALPWPAMHKVMTKAAILTNALLIALTMDFMQKFVYAVGYGGGYDIVGYVDFILSEFNTSDWRDKNNELTWWKKGNRTVDRCKYRDYRQSPFIQDPHQLVDAYERRKEWWHVLVARLAFIIVFEHSIFLLQSFIEYLVPAVPTRIVLRRKREDHLQRERFMKTEKLKEQEEHGYEATNNVM